MERCACCDKQGGADVIRHCAACKVTHYCSRECQKQHWSQHKTFCRTARDKLLHDKDAAGQQTGDAEKKAGAETAASPCEGGGDGDGPVLSTCQKCGLQRTVMDKCGSCLHVTYCSRDCQRADWKTHKVTCCPGDKVTAHAQQKESGMADKSQGGAPQRRQQESSSLSSALSKVTLTSDQTVDDLSWQKARARAGELFPGHRIVDTFGQLRSDMMGAVRKEKVVAVVKMGALYPHFLRHGRCLEDAEGRSSFVLFHTADNPRPHFRYDQLRDGNFLCFQHAFIHFFSDGTVGFRIDEAREVRILEPSSRMSASASPPPVTTPQQWDRAMSRAKTLFPHQRIVDSLHSIVHQDLKSFTHLISFHIPTMTDNMMSPTAMEDGEMKGALLLQLESPVPHPMVCRWVVTDRKGKNASLHLEFPELFLPHFRFGDLRKGSFVCVSNPHVSTQSDFYRILINDVKRVGIIGQ